jgi:NTP pyrophosphatase (non-canonical NTP hydrolase)
VDRETTLQRALTHYGVDNQILQSVEELNELATDLMHYRKGKAPHRKVIEEIADVRIMCDQLAKIFGESLVAEAEEYKLERLNNRLS